MAQKWSALLVPIHPTLASLAASSVLCLCLQHAQGEQAQSSHITGSVAKPKAMPVASSLWTSISCAAGAPAGCPALGSLVQSHETQYRHIIWASAAPQVCAASTALSGCLLMVSAPTEFSSFPLSQIHSSHKPC